MSEHESLFAVLPSGADRAFDTKDGLLRRVVLVAAVAFLAGHIADDAGHRPKVVRKLVRLFFGHRQDRLLPPPTLYNEGVGKDFAGEFAGRAFASDPVGGARDSGHDGFHNPIISNVSSGPFDDEPTDGDVEAAMIELDALIASGEYEGAE